MKRRILISLLAASVAGSALLFTGCSSDVDITTINAEDTTLSAEIENDNLLDGTISLHPVIYDYNGNLLSAVNVTISDENGEVFTGTTDESGSLGNMTLASNTVFTLTVRSMSGTTLGTANIIFKISESYSSLTVYPTEAVSDSDETMQCVLEIPTDKTDIRAAIFTTEEGSLGFAGLTPWSDSLNTDVYATGAEDATTDEVVGETTDSDAAEDTEGESDTEESASEDTESEDNSDATDL